MINNVKCMPRIRSDQKQHLSLTDPNVKLSQKMTKNVQDPSQWTKHFTDQSSIYLI
jgi:hypothetical protein